MELKFVAKFSSCDSFFVDVGFWPKTMDVSE